MLPKCCISSRFVGIKSAALGLCVRLWDRSYESGRGRRASSPRQIAELYLLGNRLLLCTLERRCAALRFPCLPKFPVISCADRRQGEQKPSAADHGQREEAGRNSPMISDAAE